MEINFAPPAIILRTGNVLLTYQHGMKLPWIVWWIEDGEPSYGVGFASSDLARAEAKQRQMLSIAQQHSMAAHPIDGGIMLDVEYTHPQGGGVWKVKVYTIEALYRELGY